MPFDCWHVWQPTRRQSAWRNTHDVTLECKSETKNSDQTVTQKLCRASECRECQLVWANMHTQPSFKKLAPKILSSYLQLLRLLLWLTRSQDVVKQSRIETDLCQAAGHMVTTYWTGHLLSVTEPVIPPTSVNTHATRGCKLSIVMYSCLHGQASRYHTETSVYQCPTSQHGSIFDL